MISELCGPESELSKETALLQRCKKRQSRYRPGVAQRVPES